MSAVDEFEFFLDKHWSDGLPVVTPTEERVARMLAATRRDATAVNAAREAVDALLAQLMLFEFRNGNLRRKYGALVALQWRRVLRHKSRGSCPAAHAQPHPTHPFHPPTPTQTVLSTRSTSWSR